MKFDESQRKFCESDARHIRVLAPAGCGKTNALLYETVSAAPGAGNAKIEMVPTISIGERLQLVSGIAGDIRKPGRVAVIGRTRSQLIPYEIYYASDGGPVKTATDLDVFASEAFSHLMALIEVWEHLDERQRPSRALNDAMEVLSRVKRFPFSRKDEASVSQHLQALGAKTTTDVVWRMASYSGPKLSGKTPAQLANAGGDFIMADTVAGVVKSIAEGFSGPRFDFEKAENDVWFADPPLKQLADMAESEGMSADDLIERLDAAKNSLRHYQGFGDEGDEYR